MSPRILNDSIIGVLSKIPSNDLILPALQREFVWKTKDICELFDSLMQDYPINTMMFWKTNNLPSQPIAFYQFLPAHHVNGTTNPFFNHKAATANKPYEIVIDGQQRLTSLWIGLYGSYKTPAGKQRAELYLRLDKSNTNPDLKYDFQFLTPSKLASNQKKGEVWFRVKDVLPASFNIVNTLQGLGLQNNEYAQTSIQQLWQLINNNAIINYYEINSNNIDDVLEIFVRTNSGGYVLKKGDLLMSALTVSWANNGYTISARDYVGDIIDLVEKKNYEVDKDWVFKMFLMLFGNTLSVQPSDFMATATTPNIPQSIYMNSQLIMDSVEKAFDLVADFHLLEKGLTTKLAVIPLAYYIYKHNLSHTAIQSTNAMSGVYMDIRKYLFRAILKNLYEAGTDEILKNIRDIIDSHSSKSKFPYREIENAYNKLNVTNADIDSLLATRKQNAFPVLNIIYALGASSGLCMTPVAGQVYDVDHMHPKTTFAPAVLNTINFNTPNDANVANDGITYDTVANLELLDNDTNRSKNKKPLKDWLNAATPADQIKYPQDHFFKGLSIDIADFGTFVDARKKLLNQALCLL